MTIPQRYPGMRIGLMGGSFDPAHEGHLHCARRAMAALSLHKVWWLVSPQNPLKPKSTPLAERLASAKAVAAGDPRIVVTALEADLGLQYTVDTLEALQKRAQGARFVWVMGADSLTNFHRWRRWREIFARAPIVVVPRPGYGAKALGGRAFAIMRDRRTTPGHLLTAQLPAWTLLPGPKNPQSSTAIRAKALAGGLGRTGESS